jgi:hypothetical protein
MNARRSFDDVDDAEPVDAPRTFDDLESEAIGIDNFETSSAPAGQSIGSNHPPEPTSFEAARDAVNDLANEAQHFLDGEGVKTKGEADAIGKLIVSLRAAKGAADEARKAEARPFDDGKADVQARYNPVLKRADTAIDVAKRALAPWLQRIEDEKRAVAAKAREAADKLAAEAAQALRDAQLTNLAQQQAAEDLVNTAKKAALAANHAERDTAKAGGGAGSRAVGLRSYFTAVMVDDGLALAHFLETRLADVDEYLTKLAQEQVTAAGGLAAALVIPGFKIAEERRAV